jgi:hypothetical protein
MDLRAGLNFFEEDRNLLPLLEFEPKAIHSVA